MNGCALALQATTLSLGTEPLNEAPAQTTKDGQLARPWQADRRCGSKPLPPWREQPQTDCQAQHCRAEREPLTDFRRAELADWRKVCAAFATHGRTRSQLTVTARALKPQRRNEKLGSAAVRSTTAFEAPNV